MQSDHDKTASAAPAVTDEMVGEVFYEFCVRDWNKPSWWGSEDTERFVSRLTKRLNAALSARGPVASAEADGMVLVPREPTRAMWAAGGTAVVNTREKSGNHDHMVEAVWQAMIAAAGEKPAAPAVAEEPKPVFWAVHSRTGVHIGLWPDRLDADNALQEYDGGIIQPLFTAAQMAAALSAPPAVAELRAEIERQNGLIDTMVPIHANGKYVFIDGPGDVELDHGGKLRARAEAAEALLSQAVADEREACAQVAESLSNSEHIAFDIREGNFPEQSDVRAAIAAAIRARITLRTIQGGGGA